MSEMGKEELDRFAEIFKALSNPHRLGIFLQLISCCPPGTKCSTDAAVRQCVSELGRNLNIVSSTVSHHIKELRRAGLIRMERRGKNVQCWVDLEMVLTIVKLLTGRFLTLEIKETKQSVREHENERCIF